MNWKTFPYGLFCTLVFFVLGFIFHAWSWAWLIFMTTPIFNWLVSDVDKKNKRKEESKIKETKRKEEEWNQF